MENSVKELYKLNPDISIKKRKCIFGTGMHAKQTYVDLSIQGIKIDYFADQDVHDQESFYMGVPLISEKQLKKMDVSVIIASTAWEDISKRLYQQGITDLYVDLHRYSEVGIQNGYLSSVGKFNMETETLYVLCPAGIGDTLYVAAYAKAVKKCHTDMKRICLITKEIQACIGSFFEGVDEVIASDQLVDQLDLYSITTKTWYLNNYIYGHFKKNLCQTFDIEYNENSNLEILKYYKEIILKIPDKSIMDSFQYKLNISDKGHMRFIILIPYANTAKMLPEKFWEEIAKLFIKNNFVVYTNIKGNMEVPISGTQAICESIYDMVGVCSRARLVLSIRNGMCDVLAMSNASLVILDTDQEFYERWNTKQLNENTIHIKCFGRALEESQKDVINLLMEEGNFYGDRFIK